MMSGSVLALLLVLASGVDPDTVSVLRGTGGGGGCSATDWSSSLSYLWDAEANDKEGPTAKSTGDDSYPTQVSDQDLSTSANSPTTSGTSIEGSLSLDGNGGHYTGTMDSGQPQRDADRDFTHFVTFNSDTAATADEFYDHAGAMRYRLDGAGDLQKDDISSAFVDVTNCTGLSASTWYMIAAVWDHNGTNFDVTYYCMEVGDTTLNTGQTVSGTTHSTGTSVGWCGNRNTNSFDGLCDASGTIDGTALSAGQVTDLGECGYDGDGW